MKGALIPALGGKTSSAENLLEPTVDARTWHPALVKVLDDGPQTSLGVQSKQHDADRRHVTDLVLSKPHALEVVELRERER